MMATPIFRNTYLIFILLCLIHSCAYKFTAEAAVTGLAAKQARVHSNCTVETMSVRKEWGSMPKHERKAYTNAVLCLKGLPSRNNHTLVPGATSRYSDFAATHINLTQVIHLDGWFLSWHRFFVHLYETALREECGYQGSTPYWNWALTADNLTGSPLFDGSEYSMSSDGITIPNEPNITQSNITFPHGSGGGCIKSGPFVNFTTTFRIFDTNEAFSPDPPVDPFGYVPNCLTRDLNLYVSSNYLSQERVDNLIYNSSDIATFQDVINGPPSATGILGVHAAGHFTVGRVMLDFFSSPGDPSFFLHHGMIDRVWTLWQELDPVNRQYAISGTKTLLNIPPSPNATLDDVLSWGVLGPELPIRDLMSVTAGPFCYRYE